MKIAVMGAGAVGCFYGAMLAKAGHDVTLVGRLSHVEAVRRQGLLLDTQAGIEHVPLRASTEADGVAGAALVLFCVKSTDTEEAAEQIAPHLLPDAVLMSLQNGVDNATRLQAVLPQTVLPSVVYVATEMAGAGHVKHHGRGELVIGPSPRSPSLAAMFAAAGVPVQVDDNVVGALWAKLIINCAYNALSAISQLPYARMVRGVGVWQVMDDVVDESLAVARAAGVVVPGDLHQAVRVIAQTMPNQFSSTAQDLQRGKLTEIDHLNGYVLRQGDALGVPVPTNRVLHTLVKLMSEGRGLV